MEGQSTKGRQRSLTFSKVWDSQNPCKEAVGRMKLSTPRKVFELYEKWAERKNTKLIVEIYFGRWEWRGDSK